MPRGFSLLELLLLLTLVGILAGLAYPRALETLDRAAVERATRELVAAHARARMNAVVESRIGLLYVSADSIVLKMVAGSDTLTRWRSPGPRTLGITLSGPSRPLRFLPSGVTFGASNATYVLSRGAWTRRVIVSRWGRVRVQ
jgi:prepilin-type N-terminal cleavage/methylation domain-containing protein